MSPLRQIRWITLPAAFAAAAGLARADALPGPSPFLPPAADSSAAAPTPDATLELRGVVTNDDETLFSIYDSNRHSSDWVKLKENGHGFVVKSYDAARDTVTVDYQGRTLTLALHTAKVVSAPVTLPARQPANLTSPPPPAPQPIGGPVVLNPTPADEKRRLEAIAAEVNRRRMLRQQALQASRRAAQPGQQPPAPNQR